MKILVICQYYYPEPFRISDICEGLAERGHDVTVVTGVPNYPEGIIYKGYEGGENRYEVIGGVNVYRCNTIPRKTGAFYRILNYYSYPRSSTKLINKLNIDFDVVFIYQLSPIMMAKAGIEYAKSHQKPCILYCLDLWPKSLVAGGLRENSIIYKHYHKVSASIYNSVDKILITSQSFSDYFVNEFGIDKSKIEYLPQYAEEIFENVSQKEPGAVFDFVFAGNIGTAQSVITIVKAAEILIDEPVRFHIVGSGIELQNLQKYADEHKLKNVTFYGRRPLEEMPEFYSMADAMLLTLKSDPVLSMTLPGKIQSYMAAGKPIIAAINGEAEKVMKESNCGFCGSAENAIELACNIRLFIKHKDVLSFVENSRAYYEKHFNKESFMCELEKALNTR